MWTNLLPIIAEGSWRFPFEHFCEELGKSSFSQVPRMHPSTWSPLTENCSGRPPSTSLPKIRIFRFRCVSRPSHQLSGRTFSSIVVTCNETLIMRDDGRDEDSAMHEQAKFLRNLSSPNVQQSGCPCRQHDQETHHDIPLESFDVEFNDDSVRFALSSLDMTVTSFSTTRDLSVRRSGNTWSCSTGAHICISSLRSAHQDLSGKTRHLETAMWNLEHHVRDRSCIGLHHHASWHVKFAHHRCVGKFSGRLSYSAPKVRTTSQQREIPEYRAGHDIVRHWNC